MVVIRSATRGRIPPRWRSSARKAAQARGALISQQGDLAEAAFVHKAMSVGLVVAKPNGQNHRYDFLVDGGRALWRIQVKACTRMSRGLYQASIRRQKGAMRIAYAESELDFVVVYIEPEKTWYVLPVREAVGRQSLNFRGAKGIHRRDPYAHYREAWHLLREPDGLTFG